MLLFVCPSVWHKLVREQFSSNCALRENSKSTKREQSESYSRSLKVLRLVVLASWSELENRWGWDNFSLSDCKLCWMQSSQGLERKLEDLLSATFHRYLAHCYFHSLHQQFPSYSSPHYHQVDKFASRDMEWRKNTKLMGEMPTIILCFLVIVNEAWADPHRLLFSH